VAAASIAPKVLKMVFCIRPQLKKHLIVGIVNEDGKCPVQLSSIGMSFHFLLVANRTILLVYEDNNL
jgi:hypothetical protein